MSDWDTFRFLAEQAKKQKQPPPVQPPPWGSEMCPRCERWTRLVVNQQEGKVTCDRCSVIVDGVIVDHNPDIEWTKTIMDEKVHDGEITRVEANELSTVISRRNGKDARTRMRMATIQHSLSIDKRNERATGHIQFICWRLRVSLIAERRALELWAARRERERSNQTRRRNQTEQVAAVLVYHACLENECPLLFEELARTVLIDGDNTNVPPELQEAPDAEKIKWLSGKLAKRYKTQLKDLGIKKVGPQREAVAWVHRLNNKLAAGHRALGLTLTNLATFIAAYPARYNPRFVAASVVYLTLCKQLCLRYTLEVVHTASGVLVTNISRHNAIVAEHVPDFRDPLKGFEEGLAVEE